ncbi:unnamed protein product [Rhizophagus irregularis]|nr:unnamed protein product [Rhizophagus irregularis]
MLDIVNEFYNLNDIKINKDKSELLLKKVDKSFNYSNSLMIRFGSEYINIKPKDSNKSIRILGVWNNRSNDIEIDVLIKTSGIDEQNNLIIRHLNVINNIDFRSLTIQLQKCLGCELDNIEQLNQKSFNCNILVNAN